MGLRCGTSKEGTTPMVPPSRTSKDGQGSHPREPHAVGDMMPPNGAPNRDWMNLLTKD
ncbi:hypothetical protein Zm00014a_030162 [Zea mays]|uniref:Uncharacterized protein n=1 Tax=Zea mays TaxID=4577 RepID=A0A3L6DVQ3_MAIZE|nr:hypothetical protein Zm00014a_030162 [Zea mays]